MNYEIELQLSNAHMTCMQHIDVNSVSYEDFIKNSLIQSLLLVYYDQLSLKVRNEFTFKDFQNCLFNLLEQKKPVKAIASDKLEPWLNISKRYNPEIRFNSYLKYLVKNGKQDIKAQLDAETYQILDKCHNPKEIKYEWDRRGLVYGNVQSGKTANYIGVINRAFDAGYQVVIVFTGMTEDLRSQTQRRIDEGVIGQRDQKLIGIGDVADFNKLSPIRPATTLKDDLSKKNRDILGSAFGTNEKSIWVIKKNKTVLENLILWLDKQRNKQEKIHDVPFLVIDDEADNASIQAMSKKDYEVWGEGQKIAGIDLDNLTEEQEKELERAKDRIIKAINRNIRVALSLMSHKTFIAYTATPYSIINQSEKDLQREVKIEEKIFTIDADNDLFPKHFIIPISSGPTYIGIERVFSTNIDERIPVLVNLTSNYHDENLDLYYFPSKKGSKYSFPEIPYSMEDAIIHFIIAIIIRKYRMHNDYNTLLIHTSPLTENADYVAVKIEEFIKKLIVNIPGETGGYLNRFIHQYTEVKMNSRNPKFTEYFNQEYQLPETITKKNILDVLQSSMDSNHDYIYAPLDVVSYHSSNSEHLRHRNRILDYNLNVNNRKRYKNYIVVGGNRLSRGLTLEGLTTSYFARNSTRQDSLYQMARWFGYRKNYEDLIRIFMPTHQISWFEGVYKLENELRKDFIENNEDEDEILLPKDAVIKMAYYTPDDMYISEGVRKKFPAICDPDKLRNTRAQALSKCGTTKTNRIINEYSSQSENLCAVARLILEIQDDARATLFDPRNSIINEIQRNTNSNYNNVHYSHVINLLSSYKAEEKNKNELDTLNSFIKKNREELEFWSVVVANKALDSENITELKGSFYKNGELKVNEKLNFVRRDESAFLDGNSIQFSSILDQQKDNIFDIVNVENKKDFEDMRKAEFIKKYRNQYKKPLLLIYLAKTSKAPNLDVFPLLYFFVPLLENAEKVTYVIRNN